MKKSFFLILMILATYIVNAQLKVATYDNASRTTTINLTAKQQQQVLLEVNKNNPYKCVFDEIQIDNENAASDSSIAYLYLIGNDTSGTRLYFYVRLDNQKTEQNVNYYMRAEPDGGSCTGVNCSKCKPHRNWFGGAIVSCSCSTAGGGTGSAFCNHSISNSNVTWLQVAQFLWAAISAFL